MTEAGFSASGGNDWCILRHFQLSRLGPAVDELQLTICFGRPVVDLDGAVEERFSCWIRVLAILNLMGRVPF